MTRYEVTWRCTLCDARDRAEIPTSESCAVLFDVIVEQHRKASPACDEKHGQAGIAITPPPVPSAQAWNQP